MARRYAPTLTYKSLFQSRDVQVKCLVDLLHIQDGTSFHTVQVFTTGQTHLVKPEVPIKEHPCRDNPLVITVTVIAVVLSIKLAEFGLAKNY